MWGKMDRLLFWDDKIKKKVLQQINNQLEIKNRMLKLIKFNENSKSSVSVRNKKINKLEEQIVLLQILQGKCLSVASKEDLEEINIMIEQFNKTM